MVNLHFINDIHTQFQALILAQSRFVDLDRGKIFEMNFTFLSAIATQNARFYQRF